MSRFAVNSQGLEEQLQKQSQRILEMEQSHYECQHRLATSTSLAVRYRYMLLVVCAATVQFGLASAVAGRGQLQLWETICSHLCSLPAQHR